MPTIIELLDALPGDDDVQPESSSNVLRELQQRLASKPMPTGSLRRLCSLSGLHARIGLAYFAYWMRSWFQTKDRREQQLVETHLRAAIKMLETMGYLRGAVAKTGQAIASMPEMVPDQFVEVLSALHFQAPPMHYSLIREQLVNELGDDPENVFAEFETEAIAAASLGQVHRARLKTGEQVAVKIQYPGIARTIRADMRNLAAIFAPIRLTKDWTSFKAQFEEFRTLLEHETDYEREAANLRAARALFGEDDHIVVPRVHERYSTKRLLVMDYIDGKTADQLLDSKPTQAQLDHYGELTSRACLRMFYNRQLYTDPHPGNFLYLEDGSIGFIDFGAVRPVSDEEWGYIYRQGLAKHGTHEDVLAVVQESAEFTDDELETHSELVDLMVEGFHYYLEPHVYDGLFDFGDPEYIRRGVDWLRRVSKHRRMKQKAINIFFHKQIFQGNAFGLRMGGRVNVKRLVDEEIKVTGWEF
ncbi:MAG: AarF/ABC1/UbiB kinase family protein [Planctomycetes bacterium]|nr:AarF/ABC1/UbiB kinase family protein [Planctomycetota bacterium]